MARFLRDACNNDLMLPRLEGLTPIEIMLGMGLERFQRRCVSEIVSNGYIVISFICFLFRVNVRFIEVFIETFMTFFKNILPAAPLLWSLMHFI